MIDLAVKLNDRKFAGKTCSFAKPIKAFATEIIPIESKMNIRIACYYVAAFV